MKKSNTRRVISVLAAIFLTLLLFTVNGCILTDRDRTLTVIHINDRHGRMNADPYLSQLAKKTTGNVLILDGGDALQGQVTTNLSKGAAMVELMNEVGYSAMVVGNHEFSYGTDRLVELSEMMDFPLLAANVKTFDGEDIFQSYEIFHMDGMTVGLFGLTTPETVSSSDPRIMEGLLFENPVQTAEGMVKELKDEGCDIIIALTHMGIYDVSDPSNRSDTLAKIPGIDLIIDGHSHTALENGLLAGNTLIAQAGEYGRNIGVVEITISRGKVSKVARLVDVPNNGEETALVADEAILAQIAKLDAGNEEVTSVVVGYTPALLQGEKEQVRTGETNLANLITDSMRWVTGADVAFMTGGNIRASIDEGDITMGEVLTALPYSNLLVTMKLTGGDLLKILEHGVSGYPEPVGQHIQVSGLRVTYDPEAEPGSRVSSVILSDGSPLLPDKVYTVATIDFIAVGGDGYEMLAVVDNLVYYGGDADALVEYLAAGPVINVCPENRVSVINTGNN